MNQNNGNQQKVSSEALYKHLTFMEALDRKAREERKKLDVMLSEEEESVNPASKKRRLEEVGEGSTSVISTTPTFSVADEQRWQRGIELAMSIFLPLKVDAPDFTLLPTLASVEYFRKAVVAFMKQESKIMSYTFTNPKTFQSMVGRLLLHCVIKKSEIGSEEINPSALVLWDHKSATERPTCFHGKAMLIKEQVIEMDLNSERGQQAIKEQAEKAKIVANKWGRQVVQLKNSDAVCCVEDAKMTGNNFSGSSCGLSYTEGQKAVVAFRQAGAFQAAYFPSMEDRAKRFIPIPIKCDCNYDSSAPMLGRQLPKITPFQLNISTSLADTVVDPKLVASINNPAVLVFQCCNPVYSKSKPNASKNCDFKISSVDLVAAIQLAKIMWQKLFQETPKIMFPEFVWEAKYQYQTSILPQLQEFTNDPLF